MMRHRHHRGNGGEEGLTRGRKFTSDDVQLLLLALLGDEPRHGYELIKDIGARSNGVYQPSPGMIYPALTYLEELGYASVEVHGNRKRYQLSPEGREALEQRRDDADLLLNKLRHIARKMASIRRAMHEEENDDAFLPEYVEARRNFKRALLSRTDASPDEQRRIATILVRAAAEITGTTDTE
ncbi:PadR family transcriptional regulator [Mangrovitalea sediminis]|uniref:PadR family transcriptional regulator n=1 Tax=Mangrovitalea sediminis TaxID=1982043 RepID=UPI000BE56369|nr:PadR family transcriptional regulator [Mangrovitalea sediminis]